MSGHGNPKSSGLSFSLQSNVYQFIGTSDELYRIYTSPGQNRYWLESYVTTVYPKIKMQENGSFIIELKTKPLFSSLEASPYHQWEYGPITRLEEDGEEPMKIRPAYQIDGLGPRQWFASLEKKGVPWLFTSFGQSHPDNGQFGYSASSLSRRTVYDIGYDYPPTFFNSKNGKYQAPYPTDFWRNAAILTVDNRRFIVMVDVNSHFTAFPLFAETESTRIDSVSGMMETIQPKYLKTQNAPWPSWANIEPVGKAALGSNYSGIPQTEYSRLRMPTWEFSHDGRYAACVTAHREPAWSDSQYSSIAYNTDGTAVHACQEDYPGLVEVEFTIVVTGTQLEDFTFAVRLKQNYCSLTDPRIPVMVGYAVKDLPAKGVSVNDLLVLEYQYYCTPESMAEASADANGFRVPKRPAIATVAHVKKGSTVIDEWLAYYGVYPDLSRAIDPIHSARTVIQQTNEVRPFYPRFEDIQALGSDEIVRLNHYRFITHLVSIDLSTLSWVLGSSLKTHTELFNSTTLDFPYYDAEAILVSTIAFGEVIAQQSIGYPLLKIEILKLFGMSATYPQLSSMTPFYATSTLDYVQVSSPILYPPYPPTPLEENSDHADLTIHYTATHSITTTIKEASMPFYVPIGDWYNAFYKQFGVRGYTNIVYSGVFPTSSSFELVDTAVLSPTVFSFFDEATTVRPGVTWYTGLDSSTQVQQPGVLSFTGYPFGAIAIGRVIALTLRPLNVLSQRLVTHPNGSWSCFAGPFMASSQLISNTFLVWDWDVAHYEQIMVDYLVFQSEYDSGAIKAKLTTNHLDQFNNAFGKHLSLSDYHLPLRDATDGIELKPNFTYSNYVTRWYLKTTPSPMGPEWTDNSVYLWYLLNRNSMGQDFENEIGEISSFIFPNVRTMSAFHMSKL